MSFDFGQKIRNIRQSLDFALVGPKALALLPAVTLCGYWIGGEGFLIFLALVVPAIFAVTGMFSGTGPAWADARDGETELRLRGTAERALSQTLISEKITGKRRRRSPFQLMISHRLNVSLEPRRQRKSLT